MNGIREQILVRTVFILSIATASYFVATVITGMVLSYSPVPLGDMWDGTLGFYLAHQNGYSAIWWAAHNEHRIIFSRLLFWLDFKLADGTSVFTLATHPVFAALSVYTFYLFSRQLVAVRAARARLISILIACFLTAWLFQWMQHENFAWAFQSQFFMAQLFPLLSLYLLARSVTAQSRRTMWFAAACVMGVVSIGTMANGVICMPLMAVYTLISRQSWQRVLVLAGLSVVTLSFYFLDFQTPPQHSSVTQTMLQQPVDLARYVLLYMGTPFYFLLSDRSFTPLAAMAKSAPLAAMSATALMAVSSVYFLVTSSRSLLPKPDLTQSANSQHIWRLALVFYIIYLAGTALGTGGGRLIFGVDQALSYRYTTPALMAWAAVFVLWVPSIINQWPKYRFVMAPAALVLLCMMITLQFKAFDSRVNQVFDRELAVLALELGIPDQEQIRVIYPVPEAIIASVEASRRRQLSVFGQQPWQGLREKVGDIHFAPRALPACEGHLDTVNQIESGIRYRRVQGWLFDPRTRQPPTLITMVDQFNVVQGFALVGQIRRDVADVHGDHALTSGFTGYLIPPVDEGGIRLIAGNNTCELKVVEIPESSRMSEN